MTPFDIVPVFGFIGVCYAFGVAVVCYQDYKKYFSRARIRR